MSSHGQVVLQNRVSPSHVGLNILLSVAVVINEGPEMKNKNKVGVFNKEGIPLRSVVTPL